MDRELLKQIDASVEAIRQGRIDASLIGMTREERDAIQRLLDHHYSALDAQRRRLTARETVLAS